MDWWWIACREAKPSQPELSPKQKPQIELKREAVGVAELIAAIDLMSWNLDWVVDLITKKNKNKKNQQQQQKVVESSRKHTQFEEREEK